MNKKQLVAYRRTVKTLARHLTDVYDSGLQLEVIAPQEDKQHWFSIRLQVTAALRSLREINENNEERSLDALE